MSTSALLQGADMVSTTNSLTLPASNEQPLHDHVTTISSSHVEDRSAFNNESAHEHKDGRVKSLTTLVSLPAGESAAGKTSNEASASTGLSESGTQAISPPASKPHSVKSDKEDVALFTEFLQTVRPEVAQKVLRDNWRLFLFGQSSQNQPPYEFHLSFILRAGIINAPPSVLERIMQTSDLLKPEIIKATSQKSGKATDIQSLLMKPSLPETRQPT